MTTKEKHNPNDFVRRLEELSQELGELVLYERLEGEVIDSTESEVAVLYKTPEGEHLEQTYSHSQFQDGKLPRVGDSIVALSVLYSPPQKEKKTLAEILKEGSPDDFPNFDE